MKTPISTLLSIFALLLGFVGCDSARYEQQLTMTEGQYRLTYVGRMQVIESPVYQMGTGTHDSFKLAARVGADPATYLLSIVTSGKTTGKDVVVLDTDGKELPSESRQQGKAMFGLATVETLTVVLSRAQLEKAAQSDAQFTVKAGVPSLRFIIPPATAKSFLGFVDEHDTDLHTKQQEERLKAWMAERTAVREEELKRAKRERETYVIAHPELSDRFKSAIVGQSIVVGMTPAEVTVAWGEPQKKNYSDGAYGRSEQWVYVNRNQKRTYVYFERGELTTWSGED